MNEGRTPAAGGENYKQGNGENFQVDLADTLGEENQQKFFFFLQPKNPFLFIDQYLQSCLQLQSTTASISQYFLQKYPSNHVH